jgi:hypothetical protein
MWTNFFVASAGASAALAGLVIVAISVNITRILEHPHLPSRAAAAVADLILILVTSMVGLMPESTYALGVEIIFLGLVAWLIELRSAQQGYRASVQYGRSAWERFNHIVWGQVQTLPFLVGGAMMLVNRPSAFYWIATGIILTFVLSSLNTWVLLVEILR